jgi:hypothetical protein
MRSILIAATAMVMTALMLTAGLATVTMAAPATDPLDKIRLETGTTTEFGGGDYVAVNMTDGDSAAWFGIVYGNPENPNAPTLVGAYIRYLGGATVRDENGGMMIGTVPIPVLTVFAQQLDALIEFNDTGLPDGHGGRYGADNGVFDFYGNRSLDNFSLWAVEPVYKIIDLKDVAWSLGDITTEIDEANGTKHYDLALTATDLMYSKIWDNQPATNPDGSRNGTVDDGVVSKIELVFHIDASAKQMEAAVPWYDVRIDGGNNIISSQEAGTKNYTGISVDAAFKYDHIIEGWDYTAQSNTSKLMLENVVFFGTYIPGIVQKWIDAQFVGSGIAGGAGNVYYQASGSDAVTSDLPDQSTKVQKNSIEYRDNWQRVGQITWVSNVTVDGNEEQMYYQVHAGDDINDVKDFQAPADGEVVGIAVIGGYVYPAGSDIVHDPTFEAGAMQLALVSDISPGLIVLLFVSAAVICGMALVTFVAVRHRSRKKNDRYRYQVPPEYRRP